MKGYYNMDSNIKLENLAAVKGDNNGDILGKLCYFSLSSILIDRDTLTEICTDMNLPVKPGARLSTVDAFKSATGDVYERIVTKEYGEVRIHKIYCRDNHQSTGSIVRRELVKETLGETTNRYKKLANLSYDKEAEQFGFTIEDYDADADVRELCDMAAQSFELYKRCANRGQIENMTDAYMNYLEALKISVHGRLFFVPAKSVPELNIFEDFLEMLNLHNQRGGHITVNSINVIDDEKQRSKMTAEFHNSARKDIELYTEKLEHLISNDTQNPAVLERWLLKINKLEDKKQHYEEILQHELTELDSQYDTLKFLAQELTIRAASLRKCA
jgi:hypothetical protein